MISGSLFCNKNCLFESLQGIRNSFKESREVKFVLQVAKQGKHLECLGVDKAQYSCWNSLVLARLILDLRTPLCWQGSFLMLELLGVGKAYSSFLWSDLCYVGNSCSWKIPMVFT